MQGQSYELVPQSCNKGANGPSQMALVLHIHPPQSLPTLDRQASSRSSAEATKKTLQLESPEDVVQEIDPSRPPTKASEPTPVQSLARVSSQTLPQLPVEGVPKNYPRELPDHVKVFIQSLKKVIPQLVIHSLDRVIRQTPAQPSTEVAEHTLPSTDSWHSEPSAEGASEAHLYQPPTEPSPDGHLSQPTNSKAASLITQSLHGQHHSAAGSVNDVIVDITTSYSGHISSLDA